MLQITSQPIHSTSLPVRCSPSRPVPRRCVVCPLYTALKYPAREQTSKCKLSVFMFPVNTFRISRQVCPPVVGPEEGDQSDLLYGFLAHNFPLGRHNFWRDLKTSDMEFWEMGHCLYLYCVFCWCVSCVLWCERYTATLLKCEVVGKTETEAGNSCKLNIYRSNSDGVRFVCRQISQNSFEALKFFPCIGTSRKVYFGFNFRNVKFVTLWISIMWAVSDRLHTLAYVPQVGGKAVQYLMCWLITYLLGAHGGVVVKALRYKPPGRGFDSRWCHWNFSVT